MQTVELPVSVPTGVYKSFGELGPVYEVGLPVHQLPNGDWMLEVELVETGEKVEYPLSQLNQDPEAV